MTQLNLLPWIISREWTNDGKLASGAKIYTYQSGTNTPKATYKTADGTVLNTNPIMCDASGAFTCFLDNGTYRIKITDQNDVQIMPPVDGIVGAGSGGVNPDSTINSTFLKTYNELRALTTFPDFVYVAGRDTEGDGGQGWFQLIPGSTAIDDDSIVLTANSGSYVYKRIFDGVIDPRWTGLKYGVSIDQYSAFNRNTALSVFYGLPVLFTDSTYINTNVTVPSGAIIQAGEKGLFVSTLSVAITFQQGSNLISDGITFGQSVSPVFNLNTVESIKLSWMGGTVAEDHFNKFVSSPNDSRINMVVDKIITISTSTIDLLNPISFQNGSYIELTGSTLDINMKRLVADKEVIFQFPNLLTGNFNFGNQFIKPEIFGATGVISYDASKEIYAALRTGKVYLSSGKTYTVNASLSTIPTNIEITGSGTLNLQNGVTLNTTNLTIRDITVITPTAVSWGSFTNLWMYNSIIPSLYTSVVQIVDGVTYSDLSTNPSYAGSPSIYNGYLPLLPNSRALETDGTGKIIQGSAFKYDLNNWHCGGYFPHYEGSSVIGFSIEYPTSGSGYIWALSSRGRVDRSATTFNRPVGDINGFWTERLIPVPDQLVGASGWACQGFKALGSLYIMFVKSHAGSQYLLTIWSSTTPYSANSWTLQYQGAQVANSAITWDFDYIARDGNTLYASAGSYSPGVTYKVASNGTVTTKSGGSPNVMRIIGYDYDNHKILAAASISSVSNFGISSDDGFTWTWYPIADANLYGAAHCTGTIYSIGGIKPSWNIPGYWVVDTTNGTPYFVDVYINQAIPSNIGTMRAVRDSIVAVAPGNPNIILAGPRNGNGLSQKYSPYTTGYMGSIEYNEFCGEVLLGGNNNMILSGI